MEGFMDEFMEGVSLVNKLAVALKAKMAVELDREKVNAENNKSLNARETVISEKETDLNQREAKVQGIESIVRLKTDAMALKREADKAMAEVHGMTERQELANKNAKDVLAVEKKALASARERYEDDVKGLARGWDQLRAKEKAYKAEIEERIMRNIKV